MNYYFSLRRNAFDDIIITSYNNLVWNNSPTYLTVVDYLSENVNSIFYHQAKPFYKIM